MSDDSISDSEGIKQLREQFDKQAKELKSLREENGKYKASARTSSVAEILKAKGIDAKAASLYAGDDTSEDAVVQWVEEYSSVFGLKQSQSNTTDPNVGRISEATASSRDEPSLAEENAQKFVLGDPDQIMNLMNSAGTYGDLEKLLGFPKK